MKPKSMIVLIVAIFFFANCGDNKAATTKEQAADTATPDIKSEKPIGSPGNELVGTWKLRLEVFDDNRNRVPDEEEMKKGFGNNYLFQFNADGTCRIQQVYKGRYEKVTVDGREMLKVYRKRIEGVEDSDPIPDIYQITSVKKDELVLQVILAGEPTSFWFFKRIN